MLGAKLSLPSITRDMNKLWVLVEEIGLTSGKEYLIHDNYDNLHKLACKFISAGKSKGITKEFVAKNVHTLLQQCHGDQLDIASLKRILMQIIGAKPTVRTGKPYEVFSALSGLNQECSFQVLAVTRLPIPRFKKYEVALMGMSDNIMGVRFNFQWSDKQLLYIISRVGGGRDFNGDPEDLGGLFIGCTLKQEGSKLKIENYVASASVKNYNKEVIGAREAGCKIGKYSKCLVCEVGRETCALSRHPNTYLESPCSRMEVGPHKGYIPPDSNGVCLDCLRSLM